MAPAGTGTTAATAAPAAPAATTEIPRPRSAYQVLERRATVATCGWLVGLAAVAWLIVVREAGAMEGTAIGLDAIGTGMPPTMSVPVFGGMWLGMTVAMMVPTIGPVVLLHRQSLRRRGVSAAPTIAFVGGYLAAWTAAGVVPLAAFLWFRGLSMHAGESMWLPALAATVLIAAGVYQFTAWKAACSKMCLSPMAFFMRYDVGDRPRRAFRTGLWHGAYCLGCCWALMSVLVVVGLMNLVWMAGMTLVFIVEKHWVHALRLARAAGAVLILLGVAAALGVEGM